MIIGGIAGGTLFIEANTLFLISLDLGNMGCSENNANICYSRNFSTVNLLLMIIIKYLSCLVFVYPYEFIHNIEK
ncbi:hypothetical protein B9R14_02155 [Acetivibrio saccincola]|uniref:Uncharacterized protein n=1 Tax=Acetivibrio saccincola TaxID=1677857 RepID=A0A2S8R7B2_9FIRM|nr:hypothetical protein B9R14_02155 [Acetivibrio saccincola]